MQQKLKRGGKPRALEHVQKTNECHEPTTSTKDTKLPASIIRYLLLENGKDSPHCKHEKANGEACQTREEADVGENGQRLHED